jgi:diguanylate cyclase (GGDEF)-like protein
VVGPILLLVNDPQRADRIRAALGDWAAEVSDTTSQTARLVITDRAQRDALVQQYGPVGVIAVAGGDGDVALSDDFTPRELRLACELLDEIVDLRKANSATSLRQRQWQQLALSDPLTGLANRRAWEEEVQRRIDDAGAGQTCIALLDLDHFKRINDEHGHAAGDDVLRRAADALRRNVRDNDFLARLGGDEFGMILDSLSQDNAAAVCERIRIAVGHELVASAPQAITASIGFAVRISSANRTADQLYSAASDALRRAKQAGRDRTISATQ